MKVLESVANMSHNFSETVHAEIYYISKTGTPYKEYTARIIPFIPEMENANNVILFHHINSDIITSGQISGFNYDIGLYLYMFSIDENNNVIINREV